MGEVTFRLMVVVRSARLGAIDCTVKSPNEPALLTRIVEAVEDHGMALRMDSHLLVETGSLKFTECDSIVSSLLEPV